MVRITFGGFLSDQRERAILGDLVQPLHDLLSLGMVVKVYDQTVNYVA